ncbi:MAG: hypothetical protein SFV22_14210, partial [Saprospiraceae bacterium]|nr:hypothetical protein [Saprospiraceae bacterium]
TIGIPVVTSREGCFEEVGGEAALYADPTNAPELAQQLRQVLDTQVRIRLIAAMPTQTAQFAPEKISTTWMNLYMELA